MKSRKDMLKQIESSEHQQLRRLSPQEAFKMGSDGDFSQYELAANKVALAILKFFRSHPSVDPHEINGWSEFWFVADPETVKAIDEIGPSGWQAEWALANVIWILKEV